MVKKQTKVDASGTDTSAHPPEEDVIKKTTEDSDKEMTDLTIKLQEKEKEAAENYDKYLRAVAELENYRKRAQREKADSIKYGNENLIRDILPHIDSLERALEHADASENFEAFKEGLKLVREQLLGCLEKHGVEKIDACGKEFDPNVHEAMLQVENDAHEHNRVVDELETGYLLHGRLLRPAKVSINKRTKQGEPDKKEQ
ncbi:MAG: nucleotide exchange factor GrpE [Deltaproteobacteria bacterium]|nr:nucleotide exchange factor GrpE [Deltaproteobacteria bacterium]